ncbi:RNA polymerase sigma factor [Kitasatospora sp. NPDC048365]|uniref:RNA polymerase sigma factor n=1 Tax=Kitasatospora sp. NPDC048365 TaxID=3364050 RepID=UPI0037208625
MTDALSPCLAGTDEPDEAAYVRFVETTKTSLFAYAVGLTGSRHLADDILQDAFVEVFKRWPDLRRDHADSNGLISRSYVFTIILNKYRDHLRRVMRDDTRMDTWVSQTLPLAIEVIPEEECIFDQTARELWAAVGELDPTQQDLIFRVYVEGKSLTKAAQEIGMTTTTARRRHTEALARLRSLIGGEE